MPADTERPIVAEKQSRASSDIIIRSFARLDPVALGGALGILLGLLVCLLTVMEIVQGAPPGQNIRILRHYFIGFNVSWPGSVIGFGYGALAGYATGWIIASLHNLALRLYFFTQRLKGNLSSVTDYLDLDQSS